MYIKYWGRMKADVRLGLCPTALVLQQSGLDAQVGDHVLMSSIIATKWHSSSHSGCITGFRQIIRRLQGDLRDEFFHFPQGNTDSEWAFACFLEQLAKVSMQRILSYFM